MRPVTLCFFLLLSLSLSAQYDRGQGYFTGHTYGSWQGTNYQFPDNPGGPNISGPTNNSMANFSAMRAGYLPLDRLLIGTRLDYFHLFSSNSAVSDFGQLVLQPFARYYVSAGPEHRVNLFGELGFGTIRIGDEGDFETDFHLGAGAEIQLRPGILGTANLNYNANASGLNFTTLDLGLNVLTGQLADMDATALLAAGTLTTPGSLGSVSYGRMKRGEAIDADFRLDFTPRLGYFVARGILLEFGTNLIVSRQLDQIPGISSNPIDQLYLQVDLHFDARYYPLPQGRLLPYLTAGVGQRFQQQEFTRQGNRFERDGSSGTWRAGGGLTYFLSPHLGLDVSARYERGNDNFSNFNTLRREVNFNRVRIGAGVRFFLPRS